MTISKVTWLKTLKVRFSNKKKKKYMNKTNLKCVFVNGWCF